MKTDMTSFENYQVRRVYDEDAEALLRLVQSALSLKAKPKMVRNKKSPGKKP